MKRHAHPDVTPRRRPRVPALAIWNMSVGFFGLQVGFGLQNANVSRIFQTLGAEVDSLAVLWIAAPLTGLLVQPLVGYMSDRTWTRFGRRRPYFLVGALLASLALIAMPNSPSLWFAAAMLWILDASINIAMEPFRAFVGDNLSEEQRTAGYAMQSAFISAGAVFASALPWLLSHLFDMSGDSASGAVPSSLKLAFYIGAATLLLTVLWTTFSTREHGPAQLRTFLRKDGRPEMEDEGGAACIPPRSVRSWLNSGGMFIVVGLAGLTLIASFNLGGEPMVLAGFILGLGLLQIAVGVMQQRRIVNAATEIMNDVARMPSVARRLALVQFFSWFALFALWVYAAPAVTRTHFGVEDPSSAAYASGADWVGILFGVYNGAAAAAAFLLPALARRIGRGATHALMLAMGGVGLLGVVMIRDPALLWLPMIGVGLAWSSILSLPYAILASVTPEGKMGVYTGVFNTFVVAPQLLAVSLMGLILKVFFESQAIFGLALGGGAFFLAAISALALVERPARTSSTRMAAQQIP